MRTEIYLQLIFIDRESPDIDRLCSVIDEYFDPDAISGKVEEFEDEEN